MLLAASCHVLLPSLLLSTLSLLPPVCSTDAEGRLTLADALWFAQEKAGATVSCGCSRPDSWTVHFEGYGKNAAVA
jgi:hypothetical protein